MFPKPTKKSTPQPDADTGRWVALRVAVQMFGMSNAGFHKGVRAVMDACDIRDEGKRGKVQVRMPGAIAAYKKHAVSQVKAANGDPLLTGGDSPGLERYRLAKAKGAEMDLEIRERTHVNANEIRAELLRFAGVIRSAIENCQRRFTEGNAMHEIIAEAVKEAESGWMTIINAKPELETHEHPDPRANPIHQDRAVAVD